MTTTSLKLPDDLKERARSIAGARGITPHAFLVESVRNAIEAAEQRAGFVADAETARSDMLTSGQGYAADEVHAYIRAKACGSNAHRPDTKPWRG